MRIRRDVSIKRFARFDVIVVIFIIKKRVNLMFHNENFKNGKVKSFFIKNVINKK